MGEIRKKIVIFSHHVSQMSGRFMCPIHERESAEISMDKLGGTLRPLCQISSILTAIRRSRCFHRLGMCEKDRSSVSSRCRMSWDGVSDVTRSYDGGRLIGELGAIMSRGVTLAFGVGGRMVEEDEVSVSSSSWGLIFGLEGALSHACEH